MEREKIYTIEGLASKILKRVQRIKRFKKIEVCVRKHPKDIGIKLDYAEAKVEG